MGFEYRICARPGGRELKNRFRNIDRESFPDSPGQTFVFTARRRKRGETQTSSTLRKKRLHPQPGAAAKDSCTRTLQSQTRAPQPRWPCTVDGELVGSTRKRPEGSLILPHGGTILAWTPPVETLHLEPKQPTTSLRAEIRAPPASWRRNGRRRRRGAAESLPEEHTVVLFVSS